MSDSQLLTEAQRRVEDYPRLERELEEAREYIAKSDQGAELAAERDLAAGLRAADYTGRLFASSELVPQEEGT